MNKKLEYYIIGALVIALIVIALSGCSYLMGSYNCRWSVYKDY